MKTLAKNGEYTLVYIPNQVNCYRVYRTYPSGDMNISKIVDMSSVFTKKLKSYFTQQQVRTVIAKVHAINYVSRKFTS